MLKKINHSHPLKLHQKKILFKNLHSTEALRKLHIQLEVQNMVPKALSG